MKDVFFVGKKASGEVIATVLIIAITVIIVGVVMLWVIPIVKNDLGQSGCSSVDVSIVSSSGYTCTDLSKNRTIVMINRGDDRLSLSKIKLVLIKDGASYFAESFAPDASQTITVAIRDTNFIPDRIQISAVIKSGKVEKVCDVSSSVSVLACDIETDYRPNEIGLGDSYVPSVDVPPVVIEQDSCNDTDEANDIFVFGSATQRVYPNNIYYHSDVCCEMLGEIECARKQSCLGESCYLEQGYCKEDGNISSVRNVCLGGCSNGVCLR